MLLIGAVINCIREKLFNSFIGIVEEPLGLGPVMMFDDSLLYDTRGDELESPPSAGTAECP